MSTRGSDLPDAAVTSCVAMELESLVFPAFEGKPIVVSYPVVFVPGA